jgi:hypothetical protein
MPSWLEVPCHCHLLLLLALQLTRKQQHHKQQQHCRQALVCSCLPAAWLPGVTALANLTCSPRHLQDAVSVGCWLLAAAVELACSCLLLLLQLRCHTVEVAALDCRIPTPTGLWALWAAGTSLMHLRASPVCLSPCPCHGQQLGCGLQLMESCQQQHLCQLLLRLLALLLLTVPLHCQQACHL